MLEVRTAAVYEIDGRLLVRTVNRCGHAGIEEKRTDIVDGYPGIEPGELGRTVQAALARCREVSWPTSWPLMRDYARPLLELSPRRYRSYRSWQRAARYASVRATEESVRAERWYPDLGRGGWEPIPSDPVEDEWTYEVVVPADVGLAGMGAAILTVLAAPPLRDVPL
ncbi:hypothetical protein AB0K00_53290 [Dactylosporangium sp. NPDC049525]|uniref:hypothetical protein n=1 Tax=Dactylosporangium sp. NPDC049525 TaxID=3154730 RepID=UPI00343BD7AC